MTTPSASVPALQVHLVHRLLAAIALDNQSKAAYIGRITQTETVTIMSNDGTSFEKDVTISISWDSISKILELIGKRAGL